MRIKLLPVTICLVICIVEGVSFAAYKLPRTKETLWPQKPSVYLPEARRVNQP